VKKLDHWEVDKISEQIFHECANTWATTAVMWRSLKAMKAVPILQVSLFATALLSTAKHHATILCICAAKVNEKRHVVKTSTFLCRAESRSGTRNYLD
jgi:hypothetical protein